MRYRIRNVNDTKLFWSNEYGWTEYDQADVFLISDKEGLLNLPMEGEWFSCRSGQKDRLVEGGD